MALSSTWNTAATLGRRNVLASIGMVLVAVFVVFALFAPWIAPQNPSNIDLPSRLQPPSGAHWFGTDELGRDIFSRVIYGARISMLVGSSVVAGSLLLGLILGSIAGYYGGLGRQIFQRHRDECVSFFPGNSAGDCVCGFSGAGNFQSDPGALHRRMGGLRPTGARAGAGGKRKRICGSGAGTGRERLADRHAAHSAQHYSAGDRAGRNRNGGSRTGGSDDELPGVGRSAADGKLGIDAE